MEATIQQNGKEVVEEDSLPSVLPSVTPLGLVENGDQVKNALDITGDSHLSQQSALLTSDGVPSPTWKTSNSFQATTDNLKYLLTTDEVVRQSVINDNWKIVESRKSRMVSTLPRYSVRSLVPPFLENHDRISENLFSSSGTIVHTSSSTGRLNSYQERNTGLHNGSLLSRSTVTSLSYNGKSGRADFGANATKVRSTSVESETLQEKLHQNHRFGATESKKSRRMSFNDSLDGDDDDNDDADDLFSITMRKRRNVPLPGFGDSDDGEENSAGEEVVPYASQWSMKDKGSLSFYDNLMELDIKKPLYMLVPDSLGNSTPKVGDLELDQLSELSENEAAKSDENPLSDADDDFARHNNPRKLSRKDSSMQTDDPYTASRMKETGTMTAADIIAEIEAERSGNPRQRSFIPMPTKSTEGDEVDPKFTKRPATHFEVLEGEAMSITCQLDGRPPIDVFWFRDMEEVTQLEESDRCDISHSGDTFTLTLFDTTEKDGGQYLCIGVNSQGHCVQGFQVNIQENKSQRILPSFLVGLTNIEVFKGDRATFGCKVTGYPAPRVLWYLKGERCKDGKKYKIANDGSGGHKLIVRDVDETNTSYTAVARNVNGQVSSTAQVNVTERDVENSKTASSLSSVTSPYPDVDELVLIAQKVASTSTGIAPPRTTSRTFSFTPDKAFDESKRERDKIHSDTNLKEQVPQLKAYRESDEVFLPLPTKNKDSSDDEQELNVSYPEFERLFEARLISRSQLHSGRVYKKDLVKIQAFLKQVSSSDNKKPQETETDDDVLLCVNCGLKSVNPSIYRRDYVVSVDSESRHKEHQQTAGRLLRPTSLISNLTAKSVKVSTTGLEGVSIQDRNNNINRTNQIMNAAAEHGNNGLRSSQSVNGNSEGDHDTDVDEKFVMPCVKELLAKFGGPLSPKSPVDDVSPLKRIHSLTGRSVPAFVRERMQRLQSSSSSSTDDKRNNASEDYNRFSLPAEHSTYVDGAPITVASTNNNGHVTPETISNRHVSNHSASPNTTHNNMRALERELLQNSRAPSGSNSRSVGNSVSDLQERDVKAVSSQYNREEDTVVRQRAVYWQKFITQQQKPSAEFPKMPNGSFNSGDD